MSGLENAALLALVAIVPLVVLTLTSFVKLSVVLSLLRNAIGAPDAPSGLVVTGLSLVLTFFVMAPVAIKMVQAAASAPAPGTAPAPTPGQAPAPGTAPAPTKAPAPGTAPAPAPGQAPAPGTAPAPTKAPAPGTAPAPVTAPAPGAAPATTPTKAPAPGGAPAPAPAPATAPAAVRSEPTPPSTNEPTVEVALHKLVPAQYQPQLAAAERALEPLRAFLAKHARDADRETFTSLAKKLGNGVTGDELWVLAPAFITTELREAFVIAILIFIPFLVIDLVVGLSLASLGLQSTSPQTVALPLKLVLFVAVDGWRLLLDALLRGYA